MLKDPSLSTNDATNDHGNNPDNIELEAAMDDLDANYPDSSSKLEPHQNISQQVTTEFGHLKVTENVESDKIIVEDQNTLSTEDVDALLDNCLLQAFYTTPKDKDLPIAGSTLWSNHVLPCKPPGTVLDIKKEIHKKDLAPTFINRMQQHHQVTRGKESAVLKGGLKPLQIMTERMQWNKKVTKVSGMESFLIDAELLASELQKKFACSTSVTELPAGKKGYEVLVEGGRSSIPEPSSPPPLPPSTSISISGHHLQILRRRLPTDWKIGNGLLGFNQRSLTSTLRLCRHPSTVICSSLSPETLNQLVRRRLRSLFGFSEEEETWRSSSCRSKTESP
ncbi:hypothetical protein L2E82_07648 [Cichorium intybus]|uniref:Uncharacterized protein n=1 Tax=Cichorium intybus TaxID=13427 RepID=A0ACB9G5C9_CICIN|nr:hypothetical protein L2E82_07648 [Cichorium intybus]